MLVYQFFIPTWGGVGRSGEETVGEVEGRRVHVDRVGEGERVTTVSRVRVGRDRREGEGGSIEHRRPLSFQNLDPHFRVYPT